MAPGMSTLIKEEGDQKPLAPSASASTLGGGSTGTWRKQLAEEAKARREKHALEQGDEESSKKPKITASGGVATLFSPLAQAQPAPSAMQPQRQAEMKFAGGRILITRTPGRQSLRNTVSFSDLIDAPALRSAFIFSYFIADGEFFPLFQGVPATCKLHVVRDLSMDGQVMQQLGLVGKKPKKGDTREHSKVGDAFWKQKLGSNWTTAYAPISGGQAHTKLMMLDYGTFMRFVVTSANSMNIDYHLADNLFYVHDFPQFAAPTGEGMRFWGDNGQEWSHEAKRFKGALTTLLLDLTAPPEHLSMSDDKSWYYRMSRSFDFASAKVSIILSTPGTHKGDEHGLPRLRDVVKNMVPKTLTAARLEVNCASIGGCKKDWLDSVFICATGGLLKPPSDTKDWLQLVYPTMADIKAVDPSERQGDLHMGFHVSDLATIKGCLRKWTSKDALTHVFHSKSLMLFDGADASDSHKKPLWLYLGSANFSEGAWGGYSQDEKGCKRKAMAIKNFEAGVVIRGEDIESMLEPGSSWEDIVTYQRPAVSYGDGDRHWNSDAWITGRSS